MHKYNVLLLSHHTYLEILTDEMKCTNFFLSIGIIISPSDVYFLSYNSFSGACESAAESATNFTLVLLYIYFSNDLFR